MLLSNKNVSGHVKAHKINNDEINFSSYIDLVFSDGSIAFFDEGELKYILVKDKKNVKYFKKYFTRF